MINERFGDFIRRSRVDKGLTLTKLAAFLDIDQATLSKIENNKRQLPSKLLPLLAEMFALDLENLKNEFYAEMIAEIMIKEDCSKSVLALSEKKIELLKEKMIFQPELNLK